MNRRLAWLVGAGLALGLVAAAGLYFARDARDDRAPRLADYVGASACRECHAADFEAWRASHHALAMQPASDSTVLGDFDGATFRHQGVESRFFRRDGAFYVRTEGPDGSLGDYEIRHTFGVFPLQQYLVAFPGGRLQALGVAWDSRPRNEGGQRWFHLYPDRRLRPGEPLHWTGIDQNWNHMCAECHATNLRKRYNAATDTYQTTWSELTVACEACHGPGSLHVAWAKAGAPPKETTYGLSVAFRDRGRAEWVMDPAAGVARRSGPPSSHAEVEACAPCHSRRGVLREGHVAGKPLGDSYRAALLEPGLYYADGQIRDEVYEYGSFLQSKMHGAGVTCSDCHDPHSGKTRAEGNALCAGCHWPERFDTPAHHFHPTGSRGAQCVECHMPAKSYMVVDPRRDHSIRVPRPDLSVTLGTPNACTGCHRDRAPQWATDAIVRWHGARERASHFGEMLHAARYLHPGADRDLAVLVGDSTAPGIVRATALAELVHTAGRRLPDALPRALADPDPLVREAAASAAEAWDVSARGPIAPLLADPVRTVRIAAARQLAAVSPDRWSAHQRAALDRALKEYRDAQTINADRPDAHFNLGSLETDLGRLNQAERSYKMALAIDSTFAAAYVNLADLYRIEGRDAEAVDVLRVGLARLPGEAALHYALGLALVREQELPEALRALRQATLLAPDDLRPAYVYAVGLLTAGESEQALAILEKTHARYPGDRDVLVALATACRDLGRTRAAIAYARKLVALDSTDADARALLKELESAQ
jgi:predicted CXXCH cytochrome family protein